MIKEVKSPISRPGPLGGPRTPLSPGARSNPSRRGDAEEGPEQSPQASAPKRDNNHPPGARVSLGNEDGTLEITHHPGDPEDPEADE